MVTHGRIVLQDVVIPVTFNVYFVVEHGIVVNAGSIATETIFVEKLVDRNFFPGTHAAKEVVFEGMVISIMMKVDFEIKLLSIEPLIIMVVVNFIVVADYFHYLVDITVDNVQVENGNYFRMLQRDF